MGFDAQMGFLAGSEELHSAFMTLEQATVWCERHDRCYGFSSHAPRLNDGASGVLYITLFGVGAAHVVYHPEWYAWTRGINDDTSTGSGMKEEL